MSQGGRRTWLAVVLAVVHPGLGHLYLRAWIKALLWAGLFVAATTLMLPAVPEGAGPVEAAQTMAEDVPASSAVALLMIVVVNAVDAGMLSIRRRDASTPSESSARSCPQCGKELDEDIDFCHWCTTRLDDGK